MNRPQSYLWLTFYAGMLFLAASESMTHAQGLQWSTRLSNSEHACLDELLSMSDMADEGTAEFRRLVAKAQIGRIDLNGDRRKEYLYLFDDVSWRGSAGCALLIGEREDNGQCRLLFNGSGWYTAKTLPQRDHGYHRLHLPCEVRFDGQRYRKLRDECPNVNVIH
jgi:hypothetical protein